MKYLKTFENNIKPIEVGDEVVRNSFGDENFYDTNDRWDVFVVTAILLGDGFEFYDLEHKDTGEFDQAPSTFVRRFTKEDEIKLQANKYNL